MLIGPVDTRLGLPLRVVADRALRRRAGVPAMRAFTAGAVRLGMGIAAARALTSPAASTVQGKH